MDGSSKKLTRLFQIFTGGVLLFIGMAIMLGWKLEILRLVQPFSDRSAMVFNAALCFSLLGAVLLLRTWAPRIRSGYLFSIIAIVVTIAALTAIEYVTGTNAYINTLFIEPFMLGMMPSPGRMNFLTSIAFIVASIAYVIEFGYLKSQKYSIYIRKLCAAIVMLIAVYAMSSAVFNFQDIYLWGNISQVSPLAAICFLLISLHIMLHIWDHESSTNPMPNWIIVGIVSVGIGATLMTSYSLSKKHISLQSDANELFLTKISEKIKHVFNERLTSVSRMGKRWSIYEPSQREWSEDAETYLVDFPEIQAIKMVYSDLSSAWVFPEKETESIKNMQLELNADFKVTLEATLKSDNAALSKPIDLPQSSQKGIITAYNLKKNGLNIGFIFIIYRMDMLMNSLLRDDDFNKVKIFEQGKAIFPLPSTPKKATAYFSKLKTIQVGTQSWEIAIEQEPNLSSGVAIGVAIGVGGCLLSLFCGLGIYTSHGLKF